MLAAQYGVPPELPGPTIRGLNGTTEEDDLRHGPTESQPFSFDGVHACMHEHYSNDRPRGWYPRTPLTQAVRHGGPNTCGQPNRGATNIGPAHVIFQLRAVTRRASVSATSRSPRSPTPGYPFATRMRSPVLAVSDERHMGNEGMTGCVERRTFLRGSGSIPSSGQGAGGGDCRARGAFVLPPSPAAGLLPIRSRPSRPSPDRESRQGRSGLSHEHQIPAFERRTRRGVASNRVSG